MDNFDNQNQTQNSEQLTSRIRNLLKRNYVLYRSTRIRGWKLFLVIGVLVGFVAGVLLVANRYGKLDLGLAIEDKVYGKGIIFSPDGTQSEKSFSFTSREFPRVLSKLQKELFQTTAPQEVVKGEEKTQYFIVIPKKELTDEAVSKLKERVRLKDGKLTREVRTKRVHFISAALTDIEATKLKQDPAVAEILPDRVFFYQGEVAAMQPVRASLTKTQEDSRGVVVGVIDTGVNIPNAGAQVFGADYSRGPMNGFNSYFQPWDSKKTYKFDVEPAGGWINVVVSWEGGIFTVIPVNVDLDLTVRDSSGNVVGRSAQDGAVPLSERVEFFVPSGDQAQQFTAEVELKGQVPLPAQYFDGFIGKVVWTPPFIFSLKAGKFPHHIDVTFREETQKKPPRGALVSRSGKYGFGEFSLRGKRYPVVVSDVNTEQECRIVESPYPTRQMIFFGFDGISIDLNHDGDFSDLKVVGNCSTKGKVLGYDAPYFLLDGETYRFDLAYSGYFVERRAKKAKMGGSDPLVSPMKTELNDQVVSLSQLKPLFDIFGSRDYAEDFIGHGTHIAGIVKEVSPDSRIYAAKVFGGGPGFSGCMSRSGGSDIGWVACVKGVSAFESDIIVGIENAVENGAKVINLSLGSAYNPPRSCSDFFLSRYVKDLVVNRNITVVVSAGNGGPYAQTIGAPGCVEEVITVGAVAVSDSSKVTDYSSRGPTNEGVAKPDLVAVGGDDSVEPAVDAFSDHIAYFYPNGVPSAAARTLFSFFGVTNRTADGKIRMSGTSMAAPYVTGVAARLLLINPQFTPADIKKILIASAKDLGLPKETQGAGLVDLESALKLAKNPPTGF